MQRLEWHCHTKSVSGALYTKLYYITVSLPEKRWQTVLSQFPAERRQWLDFPDRSWKGIPGTRRSSRKRTITNGGSTCRWYDECRRRSRPRRRRTIRMNGSVTLETRRNKLSGQPWSLYYNSPVPVPCKRKNLCESPRNSRTHDTHVNFSTHDSPSSYSRVILWREVFVTNSS